MPSEPTAADAAADRAALRAELAARSTPSLRPPSLVSDFPLRPLPADLLAKLEARGRLGYDPAGPDHPRRDRWQQAVFPGIGLAAVGVIVLLVAEVAGHGLLALVGGLLAAAGILGAVAAWSWVQADPLRIRPDERHALTAAGWWESRSSWDAASNAGPERALVDVAVERATVIAASPAWRSAYLDGHRLILDLGAELDAIDGQAFELARARTAVAEVVGGSVAEVEDGLLDRVVALGGYGRALTELSTRLAAADAASRTDPALARLSGQADAGRYATEGVQRLTDEVGIIVASIDATAEGGTRDRG